MLGSCWGDVVVVGDLNGKLAKQHLFFKLSMNMHLGDLSHLQLDTRKHVKTRSKQGQSFCAPSKFRISLIRACAVLEKRMGSKK